MTAPALAATSPAPSAPRSSPAQRPSPADADREAPLVKTKIVATVGPACWSPEGLRGLVEAGVDVFRLNFAHGEHDRLAEVVEEVRRISAALEKPVALLGDLSGPKIRLGELPGDGLQCDLGAMFTFAREAPPSPDEWGDGSVLTCTYECLLDDLKPGDRVLLADGTVAMRVAEVHEENGRPARADCVVEQPGLLRSKQGINLPGVVLSTPSLTDKDRDDLRFAVRQGLDYVGLSFVRQAADIRLLREAIEAHECLHPPQIVAKIEKLEAVDDLENVVAATDAVMVARGDLGVEADIARVPVLQKRIIRLCNRHRVPVITATQMLDSMQEDERPTRAEATDVANAVLDGSDAVMLSGETAIGRHPRGAVRMMSRIAVEAETDFHFHVAGLREEASLTRHAAHPITEAVTEGAVAAAVQLDAALIVVATHSGKTALSVSGKRSKIPVLALTDRADSARRMALYFGVTPIRTDVVSGAPREVMAFVTEWGKKTGALQTGDRVVLIGSTTWSKKGHDLLVVRQVA